MKRDSIWAFPILGMLATALPTVSVAQPAAPSSLALAMAGTWAIGSARPCTLLKP